MMENLRPSEAERLRKIIAKPTFNRHLIFGDAVDLATIHMNKSSLLLNRPVFVGMSILDLTKHLMYDWYYNHLKVQYCSSAELLYTKTDSLVLEIQTEDVYADMRCNAGQYDTSTYPKDHPLFSTTNKKVLGKMKDECAGVSIAEFVGFMPKMYSILKVEGDKKAKSVKKAKTIKKPSWKSISIMPSTKMSSLKEIASATVWICCTVAGIRSSASMSTRHC